MYKLLLIFFYLLFQSTFIYAQNIDKKPALIFASSNLQFVFPQLLKKFYSTYPDARVFIQYGASGNLSKDILEGKKYDIFFSANEEFAQRVYKANKSMTKPKKYLQGILILLVPTNISLLEQKMNILNSKEIKNITVANHADAPYGFAAMQALKNFQCSHKVLEKIRYSDDVATVIDNVIWDKDAGFLPKSALYMIPEHRKKEGIDWIEVDHSLYPPIIQTYVISKHGLENDNAMKFLNFIKSETGQNTFQNNGYKNINQE